MKERGKMSIKFHASLFRRKGGRTLCCCKRRSSTSVSGVLTSVVCGCSMRLGCIEYVIDNYDSQWVLVECLLVCVCLDEIL